MTSSNHQKIQIRILALWSIFSLFPVFAAEEELEFNVEVHQYDLMQPFLEEHCVRCHGPERQRGKFRVDTLGKVIRSQSEAEDWQEMLDLINEGEMPPHDEPQPTKEELVVVLEALYKTTSDARDVTINQGGGKMRRMNRREYVNTLEDRLGLRADEDLLPVDPGDFGFDTFRKELVVTPTQLQGYINAGQELIGRLIQSNLSKETMSTSEKYIFGDLSAYVQTPRGEQKKERPTKNQRRNRNKKTEKTAVAKVLTSPPDTFAKPILQRYARLLYWGREPSESLIKNMEALFKGGRKRGLDFWGAITDSMVVALASPNFIYVVEPEQALTQTEVANRIALLLWGAASPDSELVEIAKADLLLSEFALVQQMTRMLRDEKAERFYNSFGDQWLELDRLELVVIDEDLFPDVAKRQNKIKQSMLGQVRAYLRELISNNEPAQRLVSSDFTMVDPLLADFYGLKYPAGKKGFQRVPLKGKNLVRGGLLGQGAVLMLTSTGARTSPVERGVYILRKLLNRPPPPAPADVPEIEDDPKVQKSTRDLLAHHSTTPQCATCHSRIDPLGFGMESFGPMGRVQKFENEHAKGAGRDRPVDTTGQMPNGDDFDSFLQLKDYLAAEDEKIARSYVKALMSYAIGRPMGFTDRAEIDRIIEASRERNFGLGELTYQVCASSYFKTKN